MIQALLFNSSIRSCHLCGFLDDFWIGVDHHFECLGQVTNSFLAKASIVHIAEVVAFREALHLFNAISRWLSSLHLLIGSP